MNDKYKVEVFEKETWAVNKMAVLENMCERAYQIIREGKSKFTPNTTNSLVDVWLQDYEERLK